MAKSTNNLGYRLRMARERKDMTQQELADIVGTSRESIHLIEDGTTLNPRKLEEIAKALEVSPAWLRFGDEKIDKLDKASLEFAEDFNSLPEEKRKILVATLNALKSS